MEIHPFRYDDEPLRTIAHRQDELSTDEKHTGESEGDKDIEANVMTEWINLWIRQRSGDEVEGKVEVGLLPSAQFPQDTGSILPGKSR